MPWTAAALRDAYSLTQTDALIAAAVSAALEQELAWLGARLSGGTAHYTWRLRYGGRPVVSLGLPADAVRLASIQMDGRDIEDAFLSGPRTIRREWHAPFLYGDVVAEVVLENDDARRDTLVAALALETLGEEAVVRGRGWRRILRDFRGPSLSARLPDIRAVAATGGGSADHIRVGLLANAGDAVSLGALSAQDDASFVLPDWTGRRFIVIVRRADHPIRAINISGFDQTTLFTRTELLSDDITYAVWTSNDAWNDTASGASVRID